MQEVLLKDAPVGSILCKDVIQDGVLLYTKGTVISHSVMTTLLKKKISSLWVNAIISDKLDNISLNFKSLSGLSLKVLNTLTIEDLIRSAQVLVNTLIQESEVLEELNKYDRYTYEHSYNVAYYSVAVGIKYNLSPMRLKTLALGALFHDIGKIKICLDILCKSGKLTEDERGVINMHPKLGYEYLKHTVDLDEDALRIVYQHHEDYDGYGYPKGLAGNDIDDLSMIVHICDIYDALNTKRSYKEKFEKKKVLSIMDEYEGNKFNPNIYKVFKEAIPMYYIGEELYFKDGTLGVVVSRNEDVKNPNIRVGDIDTTLYSYMIELSNKEVFSNA